MAPSRLSEDVPIISQTASKKLSQVNGSSSSAKTWAHEKLSSMTLEEKVLLLTGEDLWRTNPIPRLGISRLKTSDGPVGVRGGIFTDGVSAASLPTGYVNLGCFTSNADKQRS